MTSSRFSLDFLFRFVLHSAVFSAVGFFFGITSTDCVGMIYV